MSIALRMTNLRLHRVVVVAVFFLITTVWAAEPSDDYVIGPGDLLKIEVFQVQDYSRTVRVSTTGRVSLPLVGVVEAAGQTAANLETQLAQRLAAEYIQNPFVSVFIEEYASQKVTVEGEVKKPGVFPLKGRTSLLEVLALAEGFVELSDQSRVQVFRRPPNEVGHMLVFNVEAIRNGELTDPVLQGSDVVIVPKARGRSVLKGVTDTLRGFLQFGKQL